MDKKVWLSVGAGVVIFFAGLGVGLLTNCSAQKNCQCYSRSGNCPCTSQYNSGGCNSASCGSMSGSCGCGGASISQPQPAPMTPAVGGCLAASQGGRACCAPGKVPVTRPNPADPSSPRVCCKSAPQ